MRLFARKKRIYLQPAVICIGGGIATLIPLAGHGAVLCTSTTGKIGPIQTDDASTGKCFCVNDGVITSVNPTSRSQTTRYYCCRNTTSCNHNNLLWCTADPDCNKGNYASGAALATACADVSNTVNRKYSSGVPYEVNYICDGSC